MRWAAFSTLKDLTDLFKKGIFDIMRIGFNGYLEVGENEFNELVEGYSGVKQIEEEGNPRGRPAEVQYIYEISGEGTGTKISKTLNFIYTPGRRYGIKTYAIYGVEGFTKPKGTGLSEKMSLRTRMILDGALNSLITQFHENVYDGFSLYFNRYFNAHYDEYKDFVREYKDMLSFSIEIDDKDVHFEEYYYDIVLLTAPNKYTLKFRTLAFAYHIEENPANPISPFWAIHYIGGRTRKFEKEIS
jgi:hypothetical protein